MFITERNETYVNFASAMHVLYVLTNLRAALSVVSIKDSFRDSCDMTLYSHRLVLINKYGMLITFREFDFSLDLT